MLASKTAVLTKIFNCLQIYRFFLIGRFFMLANLLNYLIRFWILISFFVSNSDSRTLKPTETYQIIADGQNEAFRVISNNFESLE